MQYSASEQSTAFYVRNEAYACSGISWEYGTSAFEELDERGSEDFVSGAVILTCQDT